MAKISFPQHQALTGLLQEGHIGDDTHPSTIASLLRKGWIEADGNGYRMTETGNGAWLYDGEVKGAKVRHDAMPQYLHRIGGKPAPRPAPMKMAITPQEPDRSSMQDELDATPDAFRAGRIRSVAIIHSRPDGGMGVGLYLHPGDNRAEWVEAVTQLLYQVQHAD